MSTLLKFTHKQLIPVAYKWVLKTRSCGVAFRELVATGNECADVIGFGAWGHSVLVEVKVSRSDFLADKKKPFRKHPDRGMGKYRFYFCPAGLIKAEELPEGWGLVYVSDTGKATCVVDPYKHKIIGRVLTKGHPGLECNRIAEMSLMYSALRRLHIKGHVETIYDKEYNYNFQEA